MSPIAYRPSLEDVLDAFAVEPAPDRSTLERYLCEYPDFAADLVGLSRELARKVFDDEAPLSADDQAFIDSAWRRHSQAAAGAIADPFSALSPAELRDLARRMDVPRQVITAFREHRVILDSVPDRFLARLAEALNCSLAHLLEAFSSPPSLALARSYKANVKPGADGPVSFERLLIDAGVAEDKRALLMSGTE